MDLLYPSCRERAGRRFRRLVLGVCCLMAVGDRSWGTPDKEPIHFQEVYDLLKANLAGATDAQLNEAAVRGLLDQLAAKVSVVGEPPRVTTAAAPISSLVFERSYGYFRLTRLAAGTDQEFQAAYEQLQATNTLKGLIV